MLEPLWRGETQRWGGPLTYITAGCEIPPGTRVVILTEDDYEEHKRTLGYDHGYKQGYRDGLRQQGVDVDAHVATLADGELKVAHDRIDELTAAIRDLLSPPFNSYALWRENGSCAGTLTMWDERVNHARELIGDDDA